MTVPARSEAPRQAISRLLRSRTAAQTAAFVGGTAVVGVLSAVAKALLAQNMTEDAFGAFAFALSVLLFASIFFDFGLFLPAARLSALARGTDEREIVGAALLAYVPVAIAFSLAIVCASFAVDAWFEVGSGDALRVVAPLALAYPFTQIALQLGQGIGRLHVYSVSMAGAQALLVTAIAVTVASGATFTPSRGLALHAVMTLVGSLVIAAWFRPSFSHARVNLAKLLDGARAYGFQVYVGRILSTGTYNMDAILIGAFTNAREVGFYTLAAAIAAVVSLPVIGFANALFPRMTRARAIDRRWLALAVAAGVVGAAAVTLAAGPVVHAVLSDRYERVIALVLPLALAESARAVTAIYNTFLAAHGRGRELRNAALVLTTANLLLNFALIPAYGAMGAAWASFGALVLNLAAHVLFYRRSVEPPGSAQDEE